MLLVEEAITETYCFFSVLQFKLQKIDGFTVTTAVLTGTPHLIISNDIW